MKLPAGSKFHLELLFQTMNGTGTGEIDLEIDTADEIPVGENELEEPLAPGAYNVTWTVAAKPDPNCDPTQQLCEQWIPGKYTANVGTCVSMQSQWLVFDGYSSDVFFLNG